MRKDGVGMGEGRGKEGGRSKVVEKGREGKEKVRREGGEGEVRREGVGEGRCNDNCVSLLGVCVKICTVLRNFIRMHYTISYSVAVLATSMTSTQQ